MNLDNVNELPHLSSTWEQPRSSILAYSQCSCTLHPSISFSCCQHSKKISFLQINTNWFSGLEGGSLSRSCAFKCIMRLIPCSVNKNTWHLNLATSRMSEWLRWAHMLEKQAKWEIVKKERPWHVKQRKHHLGKCDLICRVLFATESLNYTRQGQVSGGVLCFL